MKTLPHLFDRNRAWAERMRAQDPGFFDTLAEQQRPRYLWIGCSDSRVPANQIVGLLPGELFVHRNVANVVVHSDPNALSVLQYAVDVLGVEDVIVCGHYGCGGVRAALEGSATGIVRDWLRHVEDVYEWQRAHVDAAGDVDARAARLAELNVAAQVRSVVSTSIVQGAWERGQELAVHGWIYDIRDGLLRDLDATTTRPKPAQST
ncbi:MAG: carbonate dehydratase [Gemmatimonadota bacterium]